MPLRNNFNMKQRTASTTSICRKPPMELLQAAAEGKMENSRTLSLVMNHDLHDVTFYRFSFYDSGRLRPSKTRHSSTRVSISFTLSKNIGYRS